MLIHLGNNEFVDLTCCEMIINLSTVDQEISRKIRARIAPETRSDARSAILTSTGKWLGSSLTPEVLAARGLYHPFSRSAYFNRRLFNSRHR